MARSVEVTAPRAGARWRRKQGAMLVPIEAPPAPLAPVRIARRRPWLLRVIARAVRALGALEARTALRGRDPDAGW